MPRPAPWKTTDSIFFAGKDPSTKTGKRLFGSRFSAWLTILLNLVGGSAIVASSFMPQPADRPVAEALKNDSAIVESLPAPMESGEPMPRQAPDLKILDESRPGIVVLGERPLTDDEKSLLETLQPIVEKTGWTLFTVAMFSGFYGWLGASINRKQPSMALGNLIGMGASPLFVLMEPSAGLIGLMFAITGFTFSGAANVIENDRSGKSDEEGRSFDMGFLMDLKALKDPQARREFTRKLQDLSAFICDDQIRTAKSVANVSPELKRNTQALGEYFRTQGILLAKALSGNRLFAEHDPGTLKAVIEPNGEQTRVTALLYYVGGGLMMFFPLAGALVTGAGSLSANLLTMAIGTRRKDGMGKALEYGSLAKIPIDFLQHDPTMVGANRMIRAITIDWMAAHMNNAEENRLVDADPPDDGKNEENSV